jgi:hypothetical protein
MFTLFVGVYDLGFTHLPLPAGRFWDLRFNPRGAVRILRGIQITKSPNLKISKSLVSGENNI